MNRNIEQEYFKAVYHNTYDDLLRYCLIKARRPADVEDIMQNAYAKFYRRISRRGHADIQDPKAFMFAVMQKEISTYYRFRTVKEEREQPLPAEDCLRDESLSVEEGAVSSDMLSKVWNIIRSAPPASAKAAALHWYLGMTVPETAEAMGLSESSVSSRIFRLRREIRQQLGKETAK